ncbi:MAG: formimidoylglutamase [Bacteroidota bacterium]
MPEPDLLPVSVSAPWGAPDDPRLGRWLGRQRSLPDARLGGTRVVLVGFPSDEGVRRNRGRPGAAAGPRAIREALYAMTPDAANHNAFTALLDRTADLGDVRVTGDVETDQQRLGAVLAPLLREGVVPIVLGGGHETTYGHVLGYAAAAPDIDLELLNWDAHPDVRPFEHGAHSGSPFRQMLLSDYGQYARYRVAGLQPHRTARHHVGFVEAHLGQVVWRHELDRKRVTEIVEDCGGTTLATFDLDAVDAAHAPGVSAPNAGGLSASLWLHAAYETARSPHVTSLDVVELNPTYDVDGRTAQLAALTVWTFLEGLAERS